ncbi:siderophore-interacting protein [Pseudomonas eucalypticola]|uniref:Siderophore-interacting protein n=1 Tax=Pseudomonas eucalypticola TaxID=2599595 RepID=A0A7D5D741_9PSED|nr:siderophore-interacting protein [Pseudomonas eucalypticola]QKZ04393.1 siderophore-interacting protein [Pseudomonas eucalypticola]
MLTTLANNLRTLAKQAVPAKRASYRIFDVQLKQRVVVTPSLTRLVFTGPQVAHMRTLAPDQRIKLLFPGADGQPAQLPLEGNWHQALRAIDPAVRPPMRTYTLRALRSEMSEVDVEFVLHGDDGPASRWAAHAHPGDRLQMVAPGDAPGDPGGYEWKPPQGLRNVLLIGDETALPAIAGILEALAQASPAPQVQAFIEVPHATDRLDLCAPPGAQLTWLPRDALGLSYGEGLQRAAKQLATLPASAGPGGGEQTLEDVDIDTQILWDLAKPAGNQFYAWVAGESAAVMAIRRHWVGELGLDKRALTFMGYWRLGRALD